MINRQEVERDLTEIYKSKVAPTALSSSSDRSTGTRIWITRRAERHNDDVGDEYSDAESILSIT
jgi:hypothetical protein